MPLVESFHELSVCPSWAQPSRPALLRPHPDARLPCSRLPYQSLFSGASASVAFDAGNRRIAQDCGASATGQFVLLLANPRTASAKVAVPLPGMLRDVSPKLCSSNLPFIEGPGDAAGMDSDDGEGGKIDRQLAHGAGFVGRHLETQELIHSCLNNQLTAVYGGKGMGKSALVLEAARYLRERNRFPHGIFCCSLEGLRSMKAVRSRLGTTLKLPARSGVELCDHMMARYQCCLLILDRCEEAIKHARTQFVWFLDQLLQQSRVKILLLSNAMLKDFPQTSDSELKMGTIVLAPMSASDAALLLVEVKLPEPKPAEAAPQVHLRAASSLSNACCPVDAR